MNTICNQRHFSHATRSPSYGSPTRLALSSSADRENALRSRYILLPLGWSSKYGWNKTIEMHLSPVPAVRLAKGGWVNSRRRFAIVFALTNYSLWFVIATMPVFTSTSKHLFQFTIAHDVAINCVEDVWVARLYAVQTASVLADYDAAMRVAFENEMRVSLRNFHVDYRAVVLVRTDGCYFTTIFVYLVVLLIY